MINTTLKQLSEISGLSISTVSRALKNHPDISSRTKLLVTELANTLDYEPNINAVNLRTKNNRLFGVIVPSLSNHFYDAVIAAIEKECRKNNYALMILQSNDDPDIESANIKLCRQNRVNGVFVCVTAETKDLTPFLKLKEINIPVVFFDRVPKISSFTKVCFADAAVATMAANLIVEKQKKNVVALFADKRLSITQIRLEAFLKVMNQHHIDCVAEFPLNDNDAEEFTATHLKNKPDIIFCMTDDILAGTMRAIQKQHLKIPDDVAVLAISDGFIPSLFHPQITHVKTAGKDLGKLAFQNMLSTLSSNNYTYSEMIEPVLVEGGSL